MFFTISVLVPVIFALYAVNLFSLGWWLIPFFAGTVMTGWWVGFISAGIVVRYGPKVQTVVWTLPGILLPFSVVYFPLAILPTFLKPISYMLPTTYVFESMRALLNGGSVQPLYMVLCFGLNILYLFLSLKWFVKQFKVSMNLGLGRFN